MSDSHDAIAMVPELEPSAHPSPARQLCEEPLPAFPPDQVVQAQQQARRLLINLADSLAPPQLLVMEHAFGIERTMIAGVIARLGIADLLDDGPVSAAELAGSSGSDPNRLHRVLRSAAMLGMLTLRADGRFEHNRVSLALRRDDAGQRWAFAEFMSSEANVRAWSGLGHTVATGETAFDAIHGTTIWEWLAEHDDEGAVFGTAMMGITTGDASVVPTTYPFDDVAVVCDVGGGRGILLSEILVRHPHLRGILADSPHFVQAASMTFEARNIASRVESVPTDFFVEVPKGADLYLLKNVLHDWSDEHALAILRNVRRAANPGARVVIAESPMEANDAESFTNQVDIYVMVACTGGRERSRDEHRSLLRRAGFHPTRTFDRATLSIIEGVVN